MKVLMKDELYYITSCGGATFGGGEPLLWPDFIIDVLDLGAKRWHTTIETSLNVPFVNIERLLPYIDEYVIDIKDMNPDIYRAYTGKDNAIVVQNLERRSLCLSYERSLDEISCQEQLGVSQQTESRQGCLACL